MNPQQSAVITGTSFLHVMKGKTNVLSMAPCSRPCRSHTRANTSSSIYQKLVFQAGRNSFAASKDKKCHCEDTSFTDLNFSFAGTPAASSALLLFTSSSPLPAQEIGGHSKASQHQSTPRMMSSTTATPPVLSQGDCVRDTNMLPAFWRS